MSLKRGFFGSIKLIECNRCGERWKPNYAWEALCEECYTISPSLLRDEDFHDSGWQSYLKKRNKSVRCSICGKEKNPEVFGHVCVGCRTAHPDSTHRHGWGYAPHNDVEVEHCYKCEGVVVKKKSGEKGTARTYHRVGNKEPAVEPYQCPRNSEKLQACQSICEHDFLELYSNAKSVEEAERLKADLKPQPVALQIMSSDMGGLEHNLAYASEGSTHFWCWKCGYYLNLNPSRYGLLPKTGKYRPD